MLCLLDCDNLVIASTNTTNTTPNRKSSLSFSILTTATSRFLFPLLNDVNDTNNDASKNNN